MRLGILDIGSNTVHLLAADARPGGRPHATTSDRTVVRLMREGVLLRYTESLSWGGVGI